jgi:hypothetical protein
VVFSLAGISRLLFEPYIISNRTTNTYSDGSGSDIPASIWCFLADASSGVSAVPVLKTTGALETDPGVVAAVGSRRFAYRDRPRAGVEELDMID